MKSKPAPNPPINEKINQITATSIVMTVKPWAVNRIAIIPNARMKKTTNTTRKYKIEIFLSFHSILQPIK